MDYLYRAYMVQRHSSVSYNCYLLDIGHVYDFYIQVCCVMIHMDTHARTHAHTQFFVYINCMHACSQVC